MPSLPPTLLSLHPHSHASRLPWLVVLLPLVLCPLSFSSRHRLLFGGASTCSHLVMPPPLVVPLYFSGVLASRPLQLQSTCASTSHCTAASHHAPLVSLIRLVVALPLIMPMPPIRRHFRLLSRHCLWLQPSHAYCSLWLVVM
jgi:hypothetical protein